MITRYNIASYILASTTVINKHNRLENNECWIIQ